MEIYLKKKKPEIKIKCFYPNINILQLFYIVQLYKCNQSTTLKLHYQGELY